jgi:maleylacetoacetate isomerase
MKNVVTLYSYWRSSCSWRVRLCLELLSTPYTIIPINLLNNEHKSNEYLQVNPLGVVPSLEVILEDGNKLILTQSVAIMEYLNECNGNKLLPNEKEGRVKVRALVQVIASDTQPLQNLTLLHFIESNNPDKYKDLKSEWAKQAIRRGLSSFTSLLPPNDQQSSPYCWGSELSMADIVLVPQLYNAERFGIDVKEEFPRLWEVRTRLEGLPAFKKAHPDAQADKPKDA